MRLSLSLLLQALCLFGWAVQEGMPQSTSLLSCNALQESCIDQKLCLSLIAEGKKNLLKLFRARSVLQFAEFYPAGDCTLAGFPGM